MDFEKEQLVAEEMRAEIEAIKTEMEQLTQQFLEELKPFVTTWYREKAQKAVIDNPTITESASKDGRLSALKADLQILIDKVPELVEQINTLKSFWPQREPIPRVQNQDRYDLKRRFNTYKNSLPSPVEGQLRLKFGELAKILEKHGFLKINYSGNSEWKNHYHNSTVEYSSGIFAPENLSNLMIRYHRLHERLIDKAEELQNKELSIAKAKAQNLWDEA